MARLDPTDGGDTSRLSLSARMAQSTDDGSWKANAYLVKYGLDLFNNYTWYLTDPVKGDQFHQRDDRVYGGAGFSRTVDGTLFGLPSETIYGIQSRYDDIDVALSNTVSARNSCPTFSPITSMRRMPAFMPRTRCIGPLAANHARLAR